MHCSSVASDTSTAAKIPNIYFYTSPTLHKSILVSILLSTNVFFLQYLLNFSCQMLSILVWDQVTTLVFWFAQSIPHFLAILHYLQECQSTNIVVPSKAVLTLNLTRPISHLGPMGYVHQTTDHALEHFVARNTKYICDKFGCLLA